MRRVFTTRQTAVVLGACTAVAIAGGVTILTLADKPENAPAAVIATPAVRETPSVTYGEALLEFPQDTASDVVSYADLGAIVTAVSQAPVAEDLNRESGETHPGLVMRSVTFKVDRILWHRTGAPSLTGTFSTVQSGSVTRTTNDANPVTSHFVIEGSTWVEVGQQYVMPLALNGRSWGPIMPQAVFPWVNGALEPGPRQDSTLANDVRGRGVDDVSSVFDRAVPDPRVVKYYHLQPTARREAVHAR